MSDLRYLSRYPPKPQLPVNSNGIGISDSAIRFYGINHESDAVTIKTAYTPTGKTDIKIYQPSGDNPTLYTTGGAGFVRQLGGLQNSVTLDAPCGRIELYIPLPISTTAAFICNNSFVQFGSCVIAVATSKENTDSLLMNNLSFTYSAEIPGVISFSVCNTSSTDPLTQPIVIRFSVL